MIGIVDYNFICRGRGLRLPSLDAMKMAGYLKQENKNEEIVLLNELSLMANCSEVYFFTDLPQGEMPEEVFSASNVKLYGRYLGTVPVIVEHTKPDITLYYNAIQEKITSSKASIERTTQFLDSCYYKAYDSNGERIPLPPTLSRKRIYLYDDDILGKKSCWELLDELTARAPSTIIVPSGIKCHTIKQFVTLREDYELVSRSNKIYLDYYVPAHHFDLYFSKYKLKLLGEITKNSEVYIYIGKNYSNNAYGATFYIRNLFYSLSLIFSYWSRNIPIRVEIHKENDYVNPYEYIFEGVQVWANHENFDLTLDKVFARPNSRREEKLKKKKKDYVPFIQQNPIFQRFLGKSKNDLINTRGVWKVQ